jgi:hypothetical protein
MLPKKTWAIFGIFNAARSFQALYLSLKKFFICAQAFWAFWKNPNACKNSDILGICNVAGSFRAPSYKG